MSEISLIKEKYKRIFLLFSTALMAIAWNYNRDYYSNSLNTFFVSYIIIYYIYICWYVINKTVFEVLFVVVSRKNEYKNSITDTEGKEHIIKNKILFDKLQVNASYFVYLNYYQKVINFQQFIKSYI